jgi:pimeloyl-ACP methyl ester carboxylesterase
VERWRWRRCLGWLRCLGCLGIVGLAACATASDSDPLGDGATSSTTTSRPTVVVTQPSTTTTTVVLPEPVPVVWEACGGGLDCATVAVPVSYADPTGPMLDLALVRNRANDPEQRIGSLLMNPGGPGASGVRRVARGFQVSPEVADRFDIIGFDPRGVGQSTPITCGDAVPAFRATDLSPDTPEEHEQLEAAARAVADECVATEGDRLANLGTVAVAHDIEVIRRALGEETISFVGLSYGTLVAQLWADSYPESVRALVLDAVVSPMSSGATGSVEQSEGVDSAVTAIAEACTESSGCAPATDGDGLLESYDELARRIEAGEASGYNVGPTQLAYAAFYTTYDSDSWALLWDAVDRGLDGDLSGIAGLASSYTSLVPYTPFAVISCLDGAHPTGYEAWQEAGDRFEEASPRFGRVMANELLPCAFWPEATYERHPIDAAGAPPILVIGSTGDAATPFESAVAAARDLDSGVLLTVEQAGHVALGDSDCAEAVATRYLVDLTVPAPGTRC